MSRFCSTCSTPIRGNGKTGKCRSCAIRALCADPEWMARRNDALRRRFQADPAMAKTFADRLRKLARSPEGRQRSRESAITRRLWETSPQQPAGSDARKRAGRALSMTALAHIPRDYHDEYRRLTRSKRMLAADATAIILDMVEADRRRIRRELGA